MGRQAGDQASDVFDLPAIFGCPIRSSRAGPRKSLPRPGPCFRLMGEFVRDNALSVSGLLNRTFGGPGVKPYQPPGLWNEVSLSGNRKFVRDDGEKLYRRSMYTY